MSARAEHRSVSLRRLLRRALLQTFLFSVVPLVGWLLAAGLGHRGLPEFGADAGPDRQVERAADRDPQQQRLTRLLEKWDCSPTGLPAGVIPAHAVVRDRHDGPGRLTSFDEGWAIHTGEQTGTLVAVCRR